MRIRPLPCVLAALACALLSGPVAVLAKPAAAAKLSRDPALASDPANPYNGGADPVTLPGDARMAVFPYSRDTIYRVMTAPLKNTTIEFAKGERLTAEPAMADTIRWAVDTDGENHVFVKPNQPGIVNTLHLTTNVREYDFTLVASPIGGLFYQSVRFTYPQSLMAKVRAKQDADGTTDVTAANDTHATDAGPIGVSPDQLDFNYRVSGSASFKPETVFSDGQAVWIRLPDRATFPVPLIEDHGDTLSPNFIRRGPYLVVQQLADKIVLRAQDQEITIKHGRGGLFGF